MSERCRCDQDRAWNIVDVRDCGEIHALIAESTNTRNGQRYMCSAHDDSGLLNIFQLRAKLKRLFPDINVRHPNHQRPLLAWYGNLLAEVDFLEPFFELLRRRLTNTAAEGMLTFLEES